MIDAKDFHEIENLVIAHPLNPRLDLGERATADVQTGKLELGRKLFLRPSPSVPQPPNLRAYDVAPHCCP